MPSIIFTLLSFTLMLQADKIISLQEGKVSADSIGYTYYIKEDAKHHDPTAIYHSHDLELSPSMVLKSREGPFWTRTLLRNDSKEIKSLLIYNPRAGTNTLDTYIYQNNKLTAHYLLGDLQPQSDRLLLHRYSIFPLTLLPGENATIVAKVENYGLYTIGWVMVDMVTFIQQDKYDDFIFTIPTGFLLFFIIYAFSLFRMYKDMGYLMLIATIISGTLYIYANYGILYFADLGINLHIITSLAWIAAFSALLFRTLFLYYFFRMKNRHPKLSLLIWIIVLLLFLLISKTLYAQYFDPSLFKHLGPTFALAFLTPLISFFLAIYMWRRKEPEAGQLALGNSFLVFIISYHTLAIFGYVPYSPLTQHAIPIGLVVDAAILFWIQYLRTDTEYKQHLKEKELLLEQSRFFSIGQAIGNITHQWKTPLTRLGTVITLLETLLKMDKKRLVPELEKEIPAMQFAITHMKTTMEEFNQFYATKSHTSLFYPKKTLQEGIFLLLKSKLLLAHAQIDLQIDDNLQIKSYEHIFSNIMMVLIDNSLDAFQKNQEASNRITISISQEKNTTRIHYCDNAGGIKIDPPEKVFDYFVSSKKDKKGHGIGLAMAKILITERLSGTITVKNTSDGACFLILFP